MKFLDKVRANEFDQWVGEIQTQNAIELGVGKSLLDIGCGVGQFTPMFLEKFERVFGIDPSEEYIKEARKNRKPHQKISYIVDYGETFKLTDFEEPFDTITMNMLLEHVDDPIALLKNCKKLLKDNGRIIVQVPNSESITRRLGVLMGIIKDLTNITDKERDFYGHKRVYTLDSLASDCEKAGLKVIDKGGILYKPLPNEILLEICKKRGEDWRRNFMNALVEFGKDRPTECADLYVVCE